MPLILPDAHPFAAAPEQSAAPSGLGDPPAVRVGIINIMPKLEAYEPLLLGPLSRVGRLIEPVFIRLASHSYHSSDQHHLDRFYRTFAQASDPPLHGLIITGAPVEELAFSEVRYFRELTEVVDFARGHIRSTLGLCWGGMALGGMLGIPKLRLPKKLFGVFANRRLSAGHPLLREQADEFLCAHSRHSGVQDDELERAAADGRVQLLSHAPETGYSLFATPDQRLVMHLGHPEYIADRLVFEWNRDSALGRDDVEPPRNFDPAAPSTSWHDHRESLFASWIRLIAAPALPDV